MSTTQSIKPENALTMLSIRDAALLLATGAEVLAALKVMVEIYSGTDDILGASVKAKLLRARAAIATAEGR
jgi:hypothetical protein